MVLKYVVYILLLSLSNVKSAEMKLLKHVKCINSIYPRSSIQRFPVSEEKVSWNVEFPHYEPIFYESPALAGKEWADPPIGAFEPKFNDLDGAVNRKSYGGDYIVTGGYPQNPVGRTGLIGRGLLGRWGVNHAADPVVSRWKRGPDGSVIVNEKTQKKILEIVLIERHDCGEWAIPGGMVDPGEKVTVTLKREFTEEALNSGVDITVLDAFFANGVEIYEGYVDDPRNTDNAWMETSAHSFHDEFGDQVGQLNLEAGDDAAKVKWSEVSSSTKLYASHTNIVQRVVEILDANW